MGEPEDARAGSQTLERGLLVLGAIASTPSGLTATQVAEHCGLHRSIAYRLLVSLQRTGFAEKDDTGRYRVGPQLHALADRVHPRLRDVAQPVLHRLAVQLDATASLVEVIGDAAVATVVAEPPTDGPRFSYRVGNRDPLDRGAGGIAALAARPASDGDPERVVAARAEGFVATHGELNPGAYGVAAPVAGLRGIAASVNVVTHRADLVDTAPSLVVAAAQEIAAILR
jgi:DNA-binding IclR family transcriptional regulator